MDDNNLNIDDIIGRYLCGEATPEEAESLDNWKAAAPDNQKYFEDCERIYYAGDSFSGSAGVDAAWENVKERLLKSQKRQDLRRVNFNWYKIAAALLLMIGCGYFVKNYLNNAQETLTYVTTHQGMSIALYDKSSIELDAFSKITLGDEFGKKQRLIKLEGNAVFHVYHNDSIPFIVDAGNFFIRDIGTIFSVKQSADTDTVYVHVDEGVILLFDSVGTEITLEATQSAIYVKSTRSLQPLEEILKRADFKFDNVRLDKVIELLSKKYNTTINLGQPGLKNCRLTATFVNEELPTVLRIISETLGLEVTTGKENYILNGQPCDP